jgi:putative transposase of IS4/5 family DUF4096
VDLTDEQWEVLEPLIPNPSRRSDGRGRPWRTPRGVLDGILWVLRTGVETFLETLLGLSRDGKTIGPIPRNPLQLAALADEIASWLVLRPVEKVFFAPVAALAFVGRLLGYRASYLKYSGPKGTGTTGQRND